MEKSNLQRDLDKMVRDARCRVYGSVHYRNIELNMADNITGQLILEMTTSNVDVPVHV